MRLVYEFHGKSGVGLHIDLQIVRKEQPYGVNAERNSIYTIMDNMFKFWYRFVPQNVANIESGLGKQVFENGVLPHLPEYIGHIFENACREYMQRQNGTADVPFMFSGIGRWWGTNPKTRTQEEIDILADADNKAIFCECKWNNTKMGMDVFLELKRKSLIFEKYSEKHYMLFSKMGYNKTVMDYAEKNNIKLINLEMLYEV